MSLDPQISELLSSGVNRANVEITTEGMRQDQIASIPLLYFETEPIMKLRDRLMPGPLGTSVPVRIYTPFAAQDNKHLPVLVYFHGGGWVIGDLESHDCICRHIAHHSECIVVSVGYRLAPEHRFPAALEDSYAATSWVLENAEALGGDNTRVAVGGDSAGGNMATVISNRIATGGIHKLVLQWLAYPVTDLSQEHPSMAEFGEGYRVTRAQLVFFYEQYLNQPEERTDPELSPILSDVLPGLPPALMQIAGYDPLRDEGLAYGEKLTAAGLTVDQRVYGGLVHGFLRLAGKVDAARVALDEAADTLRKAFYG